MKESDFQSRFGQWLQHRFKGSGIFELKLCKGTSLPYEAVKDHQIAALLAANNNERGLYFKMPDCGWTNPCDCYILRQTPAFVVVMFYKRGQKEFFMIPVRNFVTSKANSLRKSLTEADCGRIGIRCS